jgi:predicted TIM-barrel fold metal-dependent hydrolase
MSPLPTGRWDCHVHVFDGRPPPGATHYAPPGRTLPMLEAAAAGLGVDRFVLVQPSVYGDDNSLLLQALRQGAGRHRGVVVIGADTTERELDSMHDAGVRGVRFNRVSPVGNSPDEAFTRLAPRLRERGWHVQWYARPSQLMEIAALHEASGVTAVLDHLGGVTPALLDDKAVWSRLHRLADGGAWIKLSGWYRLQSALPYADMEPGIRKAVALFGQRCLWGSDWPHTAFMEPGARGQPPAYPATWEPVVQALGVAAAERILRQQPQQLYG